MLEYNSFLPTMEDRVQVMTDDKLPFLFVKIIWSPEGDLQFSVFEERGHQLKYVGEESTHTPGTLRAIPSGVLNHLYKLTSQKHSLHSEGVHRTYPDHVYVLCAAGLEPQFPNNGIFMEKAV